LLHQPQPIENAPTLYDLAVGDACDGYPGECDLFAGGGNPLKLATLRAAHGEAGHDAIPFGDHILDGEMEVGKSSEKAANSLSDTLRAGCLARPSETVTVLWCEGFLYAAGKVPVIERVNPSANDRLVLLH